MSVIDDLQILITADASGVQNVLKKTLQTVQGTVNNINSEEIDWTTIFTASVSPAIISGVASMFAYAISNAVSFQAALTPAGTAAGDTSNQIAQVGQAALSLSGQTAQAPQDLANSMLALSGILPNVSDQQTVVAAMAQLASSGFGSLNDITSASIPLFQEWGATTSTQMVQVLTDLMHGAEGAKESIPALASQFQDLSPAFVESGAGLDNFNQILSTFSASIQTIGQANASAEFAALGSAASGANPALASFGGGIAAVRQSLLDNGGLTALQKMADTVNGPFKDNIGIVGSSFGVSAQQASAFVLQARDFPTFSNDAKDIGTNAQTIGQAFLESDTDLRELTKDWNLFKADVTNAGDLFLPGIGKALMDIGGFISQVSTEIKNSNWDGLIETILKTGWNLGVGEFKIDNKIMIGIISGISDAISTGVDDGLKALTDVGGSLFTNLSAEVTKAIKDGVTGAGNLFSGLGTQITSAITTGLKNLGSGAITNIENSAVQTFNVDIANAKSTVQDLATQLYNAFNGL